LIGATQVKAGNLVGRGLATPLTTVSVIDPIIFHVSINEADYLQVARRAPERIGRTPRTGNIVLTLADGTGYPQKGRVGLVERAVDPLTGTLGVQLYFPNPQKILRPNQYGRARVLLDTRRGALLVPQRAVQQLQNLYNVAVVDAESKVAFKNVTVGSRVDTLWVIEKGLEPGERVVVEGLQRIRDGMTVAAKPVSANETESIENDSVGGGK
jgi:membrane fusion protein (multidrug efflux system)